VEQQGTTTMNSLMLFSSAIAAAALVSGITAPTAAAETLKPGDPAPPFTMQGTDGKTYKLSDFKGKQAVVLAWFPKAFTPGCTAECKSLRANSDEL
jgi:thioredoxin-dependent peroxiredoxin